MDAGRGSSGVMDFRQQSRRVCVYGFENGVMMEQVFSNFSGGGVDKLGYISLQKKNITFYKRR